MKEYKKELTRIWVGIFGIIGYVVILTAVEMSNTSGVLLLFLLFVSMCFIYSGIVPILRKMKQRQR